MTKRIIYSNDDGSVAVLIPAECDLTIEEIADKDVPAGKQYRILDTIDVPSDRTFRGAWKEDLTVDLPKAKTIAHDKRRAARAEEFKPLDVEATIPAKAQQAEAKRQAIRSKYDAMQVAIDAATTPDGIKAAMPVL